MNPELLYHGSMYKSAELMPGYKRSGKLVRWDKVESNMYLYATTDKEEAIGLGFASAVEKVYGLDEYHSKDDGSISLKIAKKGVTLKDLYDLEVYIYTIPVRKDDEWVFNNNKYNSIKTEYKTTKTILDIGKMDKVDINKWLAGKKVKLLGGDFKPTTPQILYNWMIENLEYYGFPKKYLYTPDEVLIEKRCHCWEATSFAYKYLTMMGFDCFIVYLETPDLSATHSTVCYSKKSTNDFYWFEYAWVAHRGVHRYKSKQDLVEDLAYKFKQEFKNVSMMSIGHTLITSGTLQVDYYKTMTEKWDKLFTENNVSPSIKPAYEAWK